MSSMAIDWQPKGKSPVSKSLTVRVRRTSYISRHVGHFVKAATFLVEFWLSHLHQSWCSSGLYLQSALFDSLLSTLPSVS